MAFQVRRTRRTAGPTAAASGHRSQRARTAHPASSHRHCTEPVWPSRVRSIAPDCRSHSRSVRSTEPERANRPSGVIAQATHRAGMAFQSAQDRAETAGPTAAASGHRSRRGRTAHPVSSHRPTPSRYGLPGCAGPRRTAGPTAAASGPSEPESANRPSGVIAQAQHRAGMAFQGAQDRAGLQVPQPQRLVNGAGESEPTIRCHRTGIHTEPVWPGRMRSCAPPACCNDGESKVKCGSGRSGRSCKCSLGPPRPTT